MDIGIDIHYLRLDRRGIYNYVWNTVEGLCRLPHPHRLTLFLYGFPWLDRRSEVERWRAAFRNAALRYYWDGPPLRFLSSRYGVPPGQAPRRIRAIDRQYLFRLWEKLRRFEARYPNRSRWVRWLWRQTPPSRQVDVFHHTAGMLFPLNEKANVLTVHDLLGFHSPERFPEAHFQVGESFAKARCMDAILTYSEHVKQDVIAALGVRGEVIHVIPLAAHPQYRPVEPTRVRPVLERYGLSDRPYVLYIGAMEDRKNVPRLVEAFHHCRREAPALRHRLVLVGGGDAKVAAAVLDGAKRLGIEGQVVHLGYVPFEDLPALQSGADLFVFPSLFEGFGLPPLEAMACGTPVIASRTTSLPEVVGDAGLLIDPYDVADMAAAVRRVLTDANLRATLKERGLARAQLFTWEKTARLTLQAYEAAWARRQQLGPRRERGRPQHAYRDWMDEFVIQNANEYTWAEQPWETVWQM